MEPFRGYNSGRELDRCLSLAMQGAPNSHQRTFGRSKRLRLLSWGVWGLNLIGSFLPNWQGTWQESLKNYSRILGGGFKYLLYLFPSLFGEDEPMLTCAYFSAGLVQPPTRFRFNILFELCKCSKAGIQAGICCSASPDVGLLHLQLALLAASHCQTWMFPNLN